MTRHDNIKEFCRLVSDLMIKHRCFIFVANGNIYIDDKKSGKTYKACEFYYGMHFADLSTYTDEELDKSVMPW